MFIALNQEEFTWEYIANPTNSNPLQHAYEIIRENCPCKLYMDVEVFNYNSKIHNSFYTSTIQGL